MQAPMIKTMSNDFEKAARVGLVPTLVRVDLRQLSSGAVRFHPTSDRGQSGDRVLPPRSSRAVAGLAHLLERPLACIRRAHDKILG